ncbi:MAG: hypothetical protein WDN31_19045 [Hyphomicrobium sp.]
MADLNISLFRLHGPNFHPISYGYALALLSLVGLASGHVLLLIAALPLLVLIGSKGRLILVVVAAAAMFVAPYWRSPSLFLTVCRRSCRHRPSQLLRRPLRMATTMSSA